MSAAWVLVLGTEGGRLSRHIQQQLEGLWASKRGKQGDKIETAEALKAALDAGGEPWHVIIGPDDFVTNVRFRKERCFIYANKGAALRALVFQSSPVPDDGTAPFASSSYSSVAATASSSNTSPSAAPKNVTIYESEWPDDQAAAVALLLAEHVGEARSGDATSASVALKAREPNAALTAQRGPLWHVLIARDSVEMGAAVEAHAGTLLDARVAGRGGGAYRVLLWRHDLPLSLASALRLQLPQKAASLASLTCLAVSFTLTLLTHAAPLLGITVWDAHLCCHPDAAQRPAAAAPGGCDGVVCTPEAAEAAVAHVRVRGQLRWLALGFLVVAFVLKLLAGTGGMRGARTAVGGAQQRRRKGAAATGGGAGAKGRGKAKKP